MTRAASILAWISGFGFGVPAAIGIRYFAHHHEVWAFMGFPTYGHGPFLEWGLPTSIPLLVGFLVVCAAEIVVGFMLWTGKVGGSWTSLAILPVGLFFWIGFALPLGPVLGVARTTLVLIALNR
jgi:hypothetical protein